MKRLSHYLLVSWVVILLMLAGLYGYTKVSPPEERYRMERTIAKRLLLTDLCLSTESRHTRHIAMPELIAPFQDFPGYHDHFPSSSFFQVPNHP